MSLSLENCLVWRALAGITWYLPEFSKWTLPINDKRQEGLPIFLILIQPAFVLKLQQLCWARVSHNTFEKQASMSCSSSENGALVTQPQLQQNLDTCSTVSSKEAVVLEHAIFMLIQVLVSRTLKVLPTNTITVYYIRVVCTTHCLEMKYELAS